MSSSSLVFSSAFPAPVVFSPSCSPAYHPSFPSTVCLGTLPILHSVLIDINRGINEGRQAARDVDTYLMGVSTQLPKTGGIVQRAPYEIIGSKPLPQSVGAMA